jgi:tetratricopeptide (TPR) repeat protein
MNKADKNLSLARSAARRSTVALIFVIVLGMIAVYGLSRWMDTNRPQASAAVEEERLYLTGQAARRVSLSFNGLISDWYWMRALQYVGRKVLKHESEQSPESAQSKAQLDDLGSLDLRLLYPLLDTTTTLDPQFMAAYEYGAVVLPEINVDDAIRLLQKGISANPAAWQLYHHLGYIYWQRGDYARAAEIYHEGARIPGAAPWMDVMSARMMTEGGSRATAREMYGRMYEQSDDEQVKQMAARRLMQLDSLDEREAIRKVLSEYQSRAGRCASSWKDVFAALRAVQGLRLDTAGAPLDPSDTPYVLVKGGCDVELSGRSPVPYK